LTVYEEVAGDLVVLNPDVNGAHDLPLVNWAILLVQGTEVPCCLNTFLRDVPETTSPWETCAIR
jgi:hypothetical protein